MPEKITHVKIADGNRVKLFRLYPGAYRLPLKNSRFGQFRRDPGSPKWLAEIRDNETGAIVRHAGIWASLREAIEEIIT